MTVAEKVRDEPLTILLVEDNPDHTELIRRSFEKHRVANRICHVPDGEAAQDYLFRRAGYADPKKSPRPHVVLLDLRLPKVDGLEILREIKTSEELAKTPVVIITSSSADRDVTKAYEHHANSYVVKPLDWDHFNELMDDLGSYWLGWNHYPWTKQRP